MMEPPPRLEKMNLSDITLTRRRTDLQVLAEALTDVGPQQQNCDTISDRLKIAIANDATLRRVSEDNAVVSKLKGGVPVRTASQRMIGLRNSISSLTIKSSVQEEFSSDA